MKKILSVLIAFCIFGCQSEQVPPPELQRIVETEVSPALYFELDDTNFQEDAPKGFAIIGFYDITSPRNQEFHEMLNRLARERAGDILVYHSEPSNSTELKKRYTIEQTPYFLFVFEDKPIRSFSGEQINAGEITVAIELALLEDKGNFADISNTEIVVPDAFGNLSKEPIFKVDPKKIEAAEEKRHSDEQAQREIEKQKILEERARAKVLNAENKE